MTGLEMITRTFSLHLRRVCASLFGRSVVALDVERARTRAAFLAQLEAEAAHLSARSAATRERLQRMRGTSS